MSFFKKYFLFLILILPNLTYSRKHVLKIKNDGRGSFGISTFGFYKAGFLQVIVTNFKLNGLPAGVKLGDKLIGFSLEKTANPYTDQHPDKCGLENFKRNDSMVQQIFFLLNLTSAEVDLNCSVDMEELRILNDTNCQIPPVLGNSRKKVADSILFSSSTGNDKFKATPKNYVTSGNLGSGENLCPNTLEKKCSQTTLKMKREDDDSFSFKFALFVSQDKEEGLYNLNFHNCFNYRPNYIGATINMELSVEEKNPDDNYLSAGEMPLPALYLMMSLLFLLSACFWFFLLKKSDEPVFKIHYLMGVLVIIKSLSLLFHGINYHFIQIKGEHIEAWAVMFYIMHLLKGALLFTVLALIGSGWAFIKHMLSSKEKKVFMIIIPLQIVANMAMIIIEETEEWNSDHDLWIQLLYLIDFLCCGAILFPVVWSIRHLQEGSQTDGKAAMNLEKLKLFRHFYIMIVCYIYSSRIIVFLLRITVPFQYEWLDDMFREMATYVFFVMTGYKFRPATNNPYFKVDTDDEEVNEVLTTTGLNENLVKVNQKNSSKPAKTLNRLDVEVYEDDEEVNLLDVRETTSFF